MTEYSYHKDITGDDLHIPKIHADSHNKDGDDELDWEELNGLKSYIDGVRTNTITSNATPSINVDETDIFTITALSTDITSMTTNLSGTPINGQKLIIRILDDGTGRAITWGSSYISIGGTLPETTVASKYLYIGLIYNSTSSKWDCVAVSQEG